MEKINKFIGHIFDKEFSINFIWRFLQLAGKQGVVFIMFLISAKYLTPYDFGQFSYSMAIIILLGIFCDFGISTAVSKYVSESYKENIGNSKKAMSSLMIVISLFSLTLIIFSYFIFKIFFASNLYFFKYLFLLLFLIPVTSLFDGYYRGIKQFKKPSFIVLSAGIISLSISFFLISHFGILGAMLSQLVFYLNLFLFFIISDKFSVNFDFGLVKNILRYSLIIGFANIGTILFLKSFQIIAGHMGYALEVGYFELIYRITQVLVIIFSIAGQVIAVDNIFHYSNDKRYLFRFYKKTLVLSFSLSIIFTILSFLIAPYFIEIFFSNYYTSEFILILKINLFVLPLVLVEAFIANGFITPLGDAKILAYSIIMASLISFFGMILISNFTDDFKFIFYWFMAILAIVSVIKIIWYSRRLKLLTKQ